MDGWRALLDEHGLLCAAVARAAGMRSRDLALLVRNGELIHLRRGWYALPPDRAGAEITPWERRRHLHRLHTRAVIRSHGNRVAASHHSALVDHDLPTFAADLRHVHVMNVDATNSSRTRADLTVHRTAPGAIITDGVVDAATAAMGCVRTNGEMAALIASDAALHRGLVGLDDLAAACARVAGPYAAVAKRVLTYADARAESPGETRLRSALRLMGYAATPQVRLVDGSFAAVVDFMLDDFGLVIEFDGFVKYGRRTPLQLWATAADAVVAEKVREDHIRELGHGMVRVIWSDLDALLQLRRRIDAAAARGHRRAG